MYLAPVIRARAVRPVRRMLSHAGTPLRARVNRPFASCDGRCLTVRSR